MISFTSPLYSNSAQDPSREQSREILLQAFQSCRKLAFDHAPIKLGEVEKFVGRQGKISSVSKLASAFSSSKPSQLEEKMNEFVEAAPKKGEGDAAALEKVKKEKGYPSEFAFSYYVSRLLEEMFSHPPFSQKPSPTKEIRFVANFGGWMSVRKVNLEKAEKKEVVGCCATIFDSIRRKLPEYLCAAGKSGEYAAFTGAFLSRFPQRKSFARVPEILLAAGKEEQRVALFAEKGFETQLLDLFYSSALERVGFPPFVSTSQVSRVYPELKIPKPRGRIAGAGKKK